MHKSNTYKIMHLSHTEIEADSRILKEIYSALSMGFEVSAVGIRLNEGSKKSSLNEGVNIESLELISDKLKQFPAILRHFAKAIELFPRMLARAWTFKPDLVHCNDTLVLPIGLVIKWLTGSKLVYDAHELESDRNGISYFTSKITLGIEKFTWKYIDGLIVVSPSIEHWYLTNIGKLSSVVVMNSPINTPKRNHHNNYLRQKFGIPESKKVFLYVGLLAEGRGIKILLDAFSANEQKDAIVFMGYGQLAQLVRTYAENNENIHFYEGVEHEEVVNITSSADVGICLIENVSLSDYYALPNKLFEYAFAGIPVLASNFPDIRKMLEKYQLGICTELNLESIVNAIKKIDTSCSVGDNNTGKLEELSWNSQAEKMISLYQKILQPN